jgi:hypothetical protein
MEVDGIGPATSADPAKSFVNPHLTLLPNGAYATGTKLTAYSSSEARTKGLPESPNIASPAGGKLDREVTEEFPTDHRATAG